MKTMRKREVGSCMADISRLGWHETSRLERLQTSGGLDGEALAEEEEGSRTEDEHSWRKNSRSELADIWFTGRPQKRCDGRRQWFRILVTRVVHRKL